MWFKHKVNQSHYRPGQVLRFAGVRGSQISKQSSHDVGEDVSPTHWPPLSPRKYSWYSFPLEDESNPGPCCGRQDYVNEKIPMTPSGIEPATYRFVEKFVNQLRHLVRGVKSLV